MKLLGYSRNTVAAVLCSTISALAAACGQSDGSDARSGGEGATSSANGGSSGAGTSSGGSPGNGGSGPEGGTTSGSGGTPGTLTPYQACIAYMDMQCNRTDYECAGIEPVDNPCPEFRTLCPDFIFAPGSSMTVERVMACVEAWRAHPCDRLNRNDFPECSLPGTRALGEPCLFGRQCESLYCTGRPFGDCGECAPMGTIGDPCPEFGCPNGTECTGTCEPSVEFNLPPGAPCERYAQCQVGYICASDATTGDRRCAPIGAAGESCDESGVCDPGTYCDAATQRCVQSPASGEPCASSGALGNSPCALDSYCDPASQTCTRRGAAGTACTPVTERIDLVSTCELDLWCFCDDSTCTTGTCLEPRDDGEPCDEANVRCVDGTACNAGTCVGVESQGRFEAACGSGL